MKNQLAVIYRGNKKSEIKQKRRMKKMKENKAKKKAKRMENSKNKQKINVKEGNKKRNLQGKFSLLLTFKVTTPTY